MDRFLAPLALGVALALLPGLHAAAAEVFTVNTTDDLDDGVCDAGHCSLREAIHAVHAPPGDDCGGCAAGEAPEVLDTIRFAVPGSPPYTIFLEAPLPDVLEPVRIDGSTQPEPGIELDALPGVADGLVLLDVVGATVRGLSFRNFPGAAIRIESGQGTRIEGNVFGSREPSEPGWNGIGVLIAGGSGHVVGGPEAEVGNLFYPHTESYVETIGVELRRRGGVYPTAIRIEGNHFRDLHFGVFVTGDGNRVGGVNPGEGNVIEASRVAGVLVTEANEYADVRNPILGNRIFSEEGLAIDLGFDGRTPNDAFDVDRGPNELQNFPELSEAVIGDEVLTVEGALHSTPMTNFRLEFFRTSAVPPGQEFLGAYTERTDTDGNLEFDLEFATDGAPWDFVSATATSLEEWSTSELSESVFALPADSIAPTTSIVLLGDEGTDGWFRSAVTVALEAVDDPDGSGVDAIEYSVDGNAFETYPGPFEITSEGMSRVRARATDLSGNREDPPATTTVWIDTSPPEIVISSPEARSYLHSEVLQLGIAARDDGSGVAPGDPRADLDGAAVSDGQVLELLDLELGTHTLTVQAEDRAGNPIEQSVRFEVIASVGSLTDAVVQLSSRGLLEDNRVERGLLSKLRQVEEALARGNTRVAANKLRDFIDQVRAQDGNHIAPEAAALLIADAEYVLETLS